MRTLEFLQKWWRTSLWGMILLAGVLLSTQSYGQNSNGYTVGGGGGGTSSGPSFTPVLPLVWTAVAAGGTGTVVDGVAVAFACDTTGAQPTIAFDSTPVDGQIVIVKAVGSSNTNGIRISPVVGIAFEDPGNPGVVLATNTGVTYFDQGGSLTYKYQATGTRWLIAARA